VLFTSPLRENIAYGSLDEVCDEQIRRQLKLLMREFILNFLISMMRFYRLKGKSFRGQKQAYVCQSFVETHLFYFLTKHHALDTKVKSGAEAIDDATRTERD
jgi:hypothetical protein